MYEEEVVAPLAPVVEVPVTPSEVGPAPINFRNGPAVRSAVWACGLVLLLSALLAPFGLQLVALLSGGYFAVYLYRRSTGQPVSVVNGVRLGWIAGVFVFVLFLIVLTLLVVALSQPELAAQLREQAKERSVSEATQVLELLQRPSGIATIILAEFVSSTLLMGAGAAVGAKLLGRR